MLKSVEPEQLRAYIEGYAIQHKKFCVELKAWLMSLNPDDEWTDNEYRRIIKAIFANRSWKHDGADYDFEYGKETVNWGKVNKELWKLIKRITKRYTVFNAEAIAPVVLQFYREACGLAEYFIADFDSIHLTEIEEKMAELLIAVLQDESLNTVFRDEILREIIFIDKEYTHYDFSLPGFEQLTLSVQELLPD